MRNTQVARRFQQVFLYNNTRVFYLPVKLGIQRRHTHTDFEYVPRKVDGVCEKCLSSCCKLCKNPSLGTILLKIDESISNSMWNIK